VHHVGARLDADRYLTGNEFKGFSDLRGRWDEVQGKWKFDASVPLVGFSAFSAPKGLTDERVWTKPGEATTPILRSGYLLKGGKAYAVLQIFSYAIKDVSGAPGETVPFREPIEMFLNEVRDNNAPLIIDLRHNHGGRGDFPGVITRLVARKGERYPNFTTGYRLTRPIVQMVERWDSGAIPIPKAPQDWEVAALEIKKARREHREYTGAIVQEQSDLEAEPRLGGFNNKVVALISPNCVSACDIQAILFKASRRVTLIGSETNGTGAGFLGDEAYPSEAWLDSNGIVALRIPNHLFGRPGETLDMKLYPDEAALFNLNSENRPEQADITYSPTVSDYIDRSAGWFAKAIESLDAR